jgi:hypothetical protein
MNRTERRNHLLQIMNDLYAEAKDDKSFSIETIAERGGVSKVWTYRLIGPEYRRLRAKLRNRAGASNKPKRRWGQKVTSKSLQAQNKKAGYEAESASELSAMIRCVELLDERNRGLLGLVKIYERRLEEAGLVITHPMTSKSSPEGGQQCAEILLTEHGQHEPGITIAPGEIIENVSEYSN